MSDGERVGSDWPLFEMQLAQVALQCVFCRIFYLELNILLDWLFKKITPKRCVAL